MKLVNLTPHNVVLRNEKGDTVIPSSGVARVEMAPSTQIGNYGVPVYSKPVAKGVINLPEPDGESVFIVSGMVAAHVSRKDVVSPGTGPNDGAIRNEKGHIVAVTRLNQS